MRPRVFLFILAVCTFSQASAYSDSTSHKVDTLELKKKDKVVKMLFIPILSFSPETSLRFGATSIGLFRHPKADPSTYLSSFRTPISYTLNNQIQIRGSFDIYANRNDHVFEGEMEWFRFPLLFWGIGSQTQDEDEELYTTSTFRTEIQYLARLSRKLYLGAQFEYLSSDITEVEEDGQLNQEDLIPGAEGGNTSGFGVLARLDTRDNVYNCSVGFYFQAGFLFNSEAIGSDFDFRKLDLDFRYYQRIVDARHILAFQVVTEQIWGEPGFETMALLGGDQIMRGHYEGRFRDKSLYSMQLEYRIPLFRRNWVDTRDKVPFKERFGLVGFAGFGNVAPSTNDFRIEDTKKSLGFGLRYLAIPKEGINVRIDFGFGSQRPGIYFNVREAF